MRSPTRSRPAGLGLDIGVLDEGGLERALGHGGAVGEGVADVAALHAALQQQVAAACRPAPAAHRRAVAASMPTDRRLRRPGDRHVLVADRQHDGALADQRHDRLAAIAHLAVGQHRLVLDVGIDAEAVERHVGRRQHARPRPRGAAASRSPSVKRARACGERTTRIHERIGGHGVGAEPLAARDLGARRRPAAGARRRQRRPAAHRPAPARRVHDGVDDLAVAGAAAEHAAQRILDLAARRPRRPRAAAPAPPSACRACRCRTGPRRGRGRTVCSAASVPSPSPRPSTVSTARPATWPIATRQAQTCRPSSSTVQAPQSPASQPTLVPVRPRSSRSAAASRVTGGPSQADRPAVQGEVDLHRREARQQAAQQRRRPRRRRRPRCRARRRSATAARAARPRRGRPGRSRGAPTSAASSAGSRCGDRRAGADGDARRGDPAVGDLQRGRRHGDRDHEIAPRAQLQERAARRHARGRGTWIATTSSPGASAVRRTPVMNWPSGRRRAPARPGELDLGVERQQAAARRRPPARRCRGCRPACRRSGSGGRRPRARPASGRRTAAADRPRAARSRSWWRPAASPPGRP